MSTTAQEIFALTMAFADQLEDSGEMNPDDTASYAVRTPGILTALQAEMIKPGDIYSTFEISNKPATNLLGYMSGFDFVEYDGTTKTFEATGNVKAYYFEVDGEGTVYVEDFTGIWNTLATIVVPNTVTDFTAYKGIVTPTVGASKSRLRFTGTYRYLITNYAMFSTPYQLSKVPDFRPWVKKTMPLDFKSIDQIIEEYPQRQYGKSSTYKWEGRGDLYINYFYEGNIRIVYRPVPSKITALTDVMQVDDVTARTIMPYGLGAELFKEEGKDNNLYSHFLKRFNELKALSMIKAPMSETSILNMYGSMNG